ncbi:MAG: hypothetical protein JRI67_10680 [Deltaproteobacteria bacterium]|nr:hypothetical protein [Deltaproteobacteria bacterium]
MLLNSHVVTATRPSLTMKRPRLHMWREDVCVPEEVNERKLVFSVTRDRMQLDVLESDGGVTVTVTEYNEPNAIQLTPGTALRLAAFIVNLPVVTEHRKQLAK